MSRTIWLYQAVLWVCLGGLKQISFSAWFCSSVDATMFVWSNTCLSALINKHKICWTRNEGKFDLLFTVCVCVCLCKCLCMCFVTTLLQLTGPIFRDSWRRKSDHKLLPSKKMCVSRIRWMTATCSHSCGLQRKWSSFLILTPSSQVFFSTVQDHFMSC